MHERVRAATRYTENVTFQDYNDITTSYTEQIYQRYNIISPSQLRECAAAKKRRETRGRAKKGCKERPQQQEGGARFIIYCYPRLKLVFLIFSIHRSKLT